ncbi:extracellular solute-binding protein [Specibacter sp. NPDC057265]|uniref:extracellular solute-binding protein n=1 Tax=Specibacter sp. NPDC057265 TaxID=3346075 RepID=UPI00364329AF
MKSTIFRTFGLVGTAALLLSSTACGITNSASDSADGGKCGAPASNADSSAVSGEVTGDITFQTQGLKADFASFFEPLIADFEAENPGVKVKWTDLPGGADFDSKMLTDAQSCTLPDVINAPSSTIVGLTNADELINFDAKIPGIGETYVPSIWESIEFSKDGGHTALPWYWGPSITTFNKTILEDAGLDPENPPATMEELFEAGKKIGASGGDASAFWGAIDWTYVDQWHGMEVKAMNEDKTAFTFAEDAAAIEWLTGMAEVYAAGGIPKDSVTSDPDPSQSFNQGKLAFGSTNASFLRNVKKNAPTIYPQTGVSKGLRNEGVPSMFNAQYITVPKSTKNLPAAAAFAEFVTSSESQLAWAMDPNVVVFPSAAEALEDPFFTATDSSDPFSAARATAAEEAKNAEPYAAADYLNGAVGDAVLKELQLAIIGEKDPAEALKTGQENANKLLSAANAD